MADIIVSLILLIIIALSIARLISDKRKGMKCSGCSYGGGCSSNSKNSKQINSAKIEFKELT